MMSCHRLAVILPPVAGQRDDHAAPAKSSAFSAAVGSWKSGRTVVFIASMAVLPVMKISPAMASRRRFSALAAGGGEVQRGNVADQRPVHLLREGGVFVLGPQARLDVAHRDLVIKRGQCAGEGRRGVAVDKDQVGLGRCRRLSPCPAACFVVMVERVWLLLHDVQVDSRPRRPKMSITESSICRCCPVRQQRLSRHSRTRQLLDTEGPF